jgi:hypothetical protein
MKAAADEDARLSRSTVHQQSDDRAPREAQERAVRETFESDEERLEAFRNQFFSSALPNLPKIEGYHVCWLTTTNPRDSIQARERLGYQPIRPEEIGWSSELTIKTGDHAGFIGVNEMVAYKVPERLYQMYMREAHHNAPLREEEKLRAILDVIRDTAKEKGLGVEQGDGTEALGRPTKAVAFA